MAEWTLEAYEYLDGYLTQVAALAKQQGDDAEDIVSGLRDHIAHEVVANAEGQIDLDALLVALSGIGSPEDVLGADPPLRWNSRHEHAVSSRSPTHVEESQQENVKKLSGLSCMLIALIVIILFVSMVVILLKDSPIVAVYYDLFKSLGIF